MTLPTAAQFKAQVEKTVKEQVAWALSEFQFSKLPITIKIADVPSGPMGQATQRLGKYTLKVQSYHFLREEILAYTEYKTYNAWPEIGGFETNDWTLALDALVAHELSHIIQFALRLAGRNHPLFVDRPEYPNDLYFNGLGTYEGNHGCFFRQIYKRFRRQFVNARVPSSAYTNPRKDFVDSGDMVRRMEAKTENNNPLIGLKIKLRGGIYEVVGRNPRNAKLYGYMVKTPNGGLAKIKLDLIIQSSDEARQHVRSNPMLAAELLAFQAETRKKRDANLKSSRTKQRRAMNARYATSRY